MADPDHPGARVYPRLSPLLAALTLAATGNLQAQVHASEPATVSQTADGTVVTIEYNRPRLRGRDSIFGGEVRWGEVWTPGANYATTLETNKDITIAGARVPAGRYSVWFVVRPGDTWTGVLDPRPRLFHTTHPDSTPEQIRFPITRASAPVQEVLEWSFPAVSAGGMTLRMNWAGAQVDLPITVPASRSMAYAAEDARPYLGRYSVSWEGPFSRMPGGTAQVVHEDGSLWIQFAPVPIPDMSRLLLLPSEAGWFNPAVVRDGAIYDVWSFAIVEFTMDGGTAGGYALRFDDDRLLAQGSRAP